LTSGGGYFEQAAAIAHRAGELLDTYVSIIDEQGVTVAAGGPLVGLRPIRPRPDAGDDQILRLPMMIDGQNCEIVVADAGNGEAIPQRLVRAVLELIVSQTAVVDRLPNQADLRNQFVHGLLRGEIADESSVRREGQILGIDLTRPRAVILIDAAGYILPGHETPSPQSEEVASRRSALRTRLIIAEVVRFFRLPTDAICAYIGDGEIAVLKASSSQDLAVWTQGEDGTGSSPSWANLTALRRAASELLQRLRADMSGAISVGVGRYHPGIRGLARSYEDARIALSLGRRFQPGSQVHSLDRLGIAAFVGISDESTKADLARHLLSPLDHAEDLLETLEAFFEEDCCPSSTASKIPVHRNTLSYRLDKITSLTGLDPRRFDDAVQIRLALVLRSLWESKEDQVRHSDDLLIRFPLASIG
jgi:carbohydrate diacid regulator